MNGAVSAFDPEEIALLITAYDKAIEALHLPPGQYDPANEVFAMKVIVGPRAEVSAIRRTCNGRNVHITRIGDRESR
jgi:hypothetical protein